MQLWLSVSQEDYSIFLFLNIDMHDSVKLFFFFNFFGLEAREILVPQPVIEPMPPPLVCRLLTTGTPGSPWVNLLTFAPGGWMCESFLCRVNTALLGTKTFHRGFHLTPILQSRALMPFLFPAWVLKSTNHFLHPCPSPPRQDYLPSSIKLETHHSCSQWPLHCW